MEKVLKVMFKFERNPPPEDFVHTKFVYSFLHVQDIYIYIYIDTHTVYMLLVFDVVPTLKLFLMHRSAQLSARR